MAAAEKEFAPESPKTRKARKKLLATWNEERELFTPQAIKETVNKIHKWIADNAKYRVPIKGKSIRLFNQNQNAAGISKKVQQVVEQIQKTLMEKLP